MFLNLFLFYQVVRPLGRKSVNKYLYLYCNYWYVCVRQYMLLFSVRHCVGPSITLQGNLDPCTLYSSEVSFVFC